MKKPLLAAIFLSFCTIASLVGMLLSSGWTDVLFFIIALTSAVWGAISAWGGRVDQK